MRHVNISSSGVIEDQNLNDSVDSLASENSSEDSPKTPMLTGNIRFGDRGLVDSEPMRT